LYGTLASSGDFDNLVQGYRVENAIAALGTGKIYAVIIVPNGFHDDLANNKTARIVVYVDDGEPGIDEQITSALRKDVVNFNPKVEVQPIEAAGPSQIEVVQKGAVFSGFSIGLTIILGLVIIFATFYEIAGGMSKEREDGTYARLLVSPISLGAIMIGKTVYDLILNTIRMFIVLGLSIYVYGAKPNADFGTILLLSLIVALLTMGFGFVISSLGLGVRAIIIVEFFLILFLFAFSGLMIDRELLRGISKSISFSLPWAYAIEALRRVILVGQPLATLTAQLQFVLVSTVVFYVVSYVLLRLSRERLAI
jgi:ABC-2 type transport system permease protein